MYLLTSTSVRFGSQPTGILVAKRWIVKRCFAAWFTGRPRKEQFAIQMKRLRPSGGRRLGEQDRRQLRVLYQDDAVVVLNKTGQNAGGADG
jgi:hypothetical protein